MHHWLREEAFEFSFSYIIKNYTEKSSKRRSCSFTAGLPEALGKDNSVKRRAEAVGTSSHR